jgi:hypothetical protein
MTQSKIATPRTASARDDRLFIADSFDRIDRIDGTD